MSSHWKIIDLFQVATLDSNNYRHLATQKRTSFVIPFVVDILVTELPKYMTLVP